MFVRSVSVLKQAREVHVAHRSTVVVKALETTVPPTPMGVRFQPYDLLTSIAFYENPHVNAD